MLKSTVSCIALLFFIQLAQGQDNVLRYTNAAELERMSREFSEADALNRKRIEEYAKKNNILIDHFLPDGGVVSVVGFDHNGKPLYQKTDNARAAATISTNRVHPSASVVSKYNLAGRGFTVGEWDGGTNRITHREYEGRAVQADNGQQPVSEHATHVGGTLIAGGITAAARGMAYQARLMANDWDNDDAEMALRASQGMLVSNHSYGALAGWEFEGNTWVWNGDNSISTMYDYKFGFYDNQARDWDRIAFNAPFYLIVKSAGNSRGSGPGQASRPNNGPYDCLPSYSVAKNILTVGAVAGLNNGYTTPNAVQMSDFSSWGPTDDGRIKPDVVGCGVNVNSSGSASDNNYVTTSGTSMSAPSVSGSCLLLQELYSNTHNKNKMRSSTLKGLVIHTADECGFTTGPDYRFGWGLVNTRKAADVIMKDSITSLLREGVLQNQQPQEITVTALGSEPLVATLVWMDYQGTPGTPALNSRLKMLVNDLDLRLINDADQSVTLPWRLNPDSVTFPARKNDNTVDNVEKIELPNPVAGQTYKLRISHKGSLFAGNNQPLQQTYSLVVSGILAGDTAATCLPLQYMNSKTGILDDGSGSGRNYAHNADCGWVLNPEDSNSIVVALVRSFSVLAGDTLYAYSGTSASGVLIGKYSAGQVPDTIRSTTSQLYLSFKSDASGNSAGWEISYSALSKPKFDFSADAKTICAGGAAVFSVQPQNGPANDWQYAWSFPGSSNENSTAVSPTVTYSSTGVYSASVSVTNKAGTTVLTKNNILTVKPETAPNSVPFFQGFESPTFPNDNVNPDLSWTITPDANPWARNTLSPYQGLGAVRIRNNTGKRDVRELISPSFNIENVPAELRYLTFRMAYARINTQAAADQLRVLVSTNCGKSWTEVYKRSHTTTPRLSTIGDAADNVVPTTFIPEPNQYRLDSISLSNLPAQTRNLTFKFEMTSEKGNFLYLDNVNFSGLFVGLDDFIGSQEFGIRVFPNPGQENSTLLVKAHSTLPIRLELTDVMGRVLAVKEIREFNGSETSRFPTGELFGYVSPGVYLIRARQEGKEKIIRWLRK